MKCRQDDAELRALLEPLPLVPVLLEPVLLELVPLEPVLLEFVLLEPTLLDSPVPDDPVPPALGVPSVGLAVELLEDAEVDAEELGVDGVWLADADTFGLNVSVGVGVGVGVAVGVALTQVAPPAFGTVSGLFTALRLAVESVGVTVVVAVPVGVAVPVAVWVGVVGVAVGVCVGVLVGVPLVVLLPVLGAELSGVTLGLADLLDLACAEGDDVEVVGHAVAEGLASPVLLVPWLITPLEELAGVPAPERLGTLLVLCDEIPAAWPIWTRASRVGGSASAAPMANTAAPTAKAGRSSPTRQSRCCPARSRSSRPVFQRRVRPARKPPAAPALACLPAWAGPAWTRARIRSRPSARGSTWSAAAWSARRRYSSKSCPCGGVPSWPGLLITPSPTRRAGQSCRARCDF